MKVLTYPCVTPEHWQQLKHQLEEIFSLTIDTDIGSGLHMGLGVQWCYDTDAQNLILQCTQKPVWLSDGFLESKITTLVNDTLTGEHTSGVLFAKTPSLEGDRV